MGGYGRRAAGWLAGAVGAAVLFGVAAGCAGGGAGPGAAVEPVELTVRHRSEWRVLWLEGETNLPDGAHLTWRVTHEAANTIPVAEWPAANLMDAGRSAVSGGAWWTRINTFNWPAGEVRVMVQFPADAGGTRAIEVEHVFEHRP